MEGIKFVPATEEHVQVLFTLLNDVYRIEVGNSGVAFKKDGEERYQSLDQVRELLTNGTLIVAEEEASSKVVGCIFYEIYNDDGGKRLYFGPLASILKGVGRALIAIAEEKAVQEGCDSVDIRVVSTRSDVLPMYQKNGFVIYGEEPFPEPAVCVRDVNFIMLRKPLK